MSYNGEFEDISSSSPKKDGDQEFAGFKITADKSPKEPDLSMPENGFIFGDKKMPQQNDNRSLNSYSNIKSKKKLKNQITIFNILISIVLVISLSVTGVLGAAAWVSADAKYMELTSDHEELGIDTEIANKLPKGIINIALFGIDSRSRVTDDKSKSIKGLSDTMMILSVNTNNNTVKLTSILRDSWVPVNGTKNKINASYSLGGAKLAIKTLNQNYGLNITDYVSVSLHQLWKVIDYMGGIDIHITERERIELNALSNSEGFGVKKVAKSGFVHLDGGQAMIYARIRKIDSENLRAMRQQKVLSCLFEKAKKMSIAEYPALLKNILKHVETSLDYTEIMEFAPLLAGGKLTLQSTNIPGDDVVAWGGKDYEEANGAWIWKYDLEEAKKFLRKWIYDIDD
jgi:LCP family protein required for cell wall assembly